MIWQMDSGDRRLLERGVEALEKIARHLESLDEIATNVSRAGHDSPGDDGPRQWLNVDTRIKERN